MVFRHYYSTFQTFKLTASHVADGVRAESCLDCCWGSQLYNNITRHDYLTCILSIARSDRRGCDEIPPAQLQHESLGRITNTHARSLGQGRTCFEFRGVIATFFLIIVLLIAYQVLSLPLSAITQPM